MSDLQPVTDECYPYPHEDRPKFGLVSRLDLLTTDFEDDISDIGEDFGTSENVKPTAINQGYRLTYLARKKLQRFHSNENLSNADTILLHLAAIIGQLESAGLPLPELPPIDIFDGDDGSISIEWIFDNFRIRFSIEPDLSESSWHLICDDLLDEINASGDIDFEKDLTKVIFWIAYFAILNA